MASGDLLAAAVLVLVVVGPVVGVTWHSVRSDHHSPLLLREIERELDDEP